MKYLNTLLFFATGFLFSQCKTTSTDQSSIPYPDPKPDSIPLIFLKGIASADSLDFNANFSNDGQSFFFSRNTNGKTHIYASIYDGKAWGQPQMLSFCEQEFSEADPFITPDGTLYYISDRKKDNSDTLADYDIWCVHPQGDGKWSAPENVTAVNSDSTEYYVSLADNKNLYFGSNRVGGSGTLDIYVSRFIDGKYTTPENLGPLVNAPETDYDPFISRDEKLLIFSSSKRKDGFGKGDLYYSKKDADGKWSRAKNLGSRINTNSYDFCPHITRDQNYFFYSSDNDIKWVNAKYLPIE